MKYLLILLLLLSCEKNSVDPKINLSKAVPFEDDRLDDDKTSTTNSIYDDFKAGERKKDPMGSVSKAIDKIQYISPNLSAYINDSGIKISGTAHSEIGIHPMIVEKFTELLPSIIMNTEALKKFTYNHFVIRKDKAYNGYYYTIGSNDDVDDLISAEFDDPNDEINSLPYMQALFNMRTYSVLSGDGGRKRSYQDALTYPEFRSTWLELKAGPGHQNYPFTHTFGYESGYENYQKLEPTFHRSFKFQNPNLHQYPGFPIGDYDIGGYSYIGSGVIKDKYIDLLDEEDDVKYDTNTPYYSGNPELRFKVGHFVVNNLSINGLDIENFDYQILRNHMVDGKDIVEIVVDESNYPMNLNYSISFLAPGFNSYSYRFFVRDNGLGILPAPSFYDPDNNNSHMTTSERKIDFNFDYVIDSYYLHNSNNPMIYKTYAYAHVRQNNQFVVNRLFEIVFVDELSNLMSDNTDL